MRIQVTVDEAIKKGKLMVNIPVLGVIVGCPMTAFYLFRKNLIPNWGIGIAILIGIILSWLMWSFLITKWRIWAFDNVRNVHELKRKAIQEKLIWKDGSVFEKTEIRSKEDVIKLQKLNNKFEIKDEYKEDYSLPVKTEIYNSKAYNYIEFGFAILIFGFGAYYVFSRDGKSFIFGIIITVYGCYQTIKNSRKVFTNKPQITLDNKGIKTINTDFKPWTSIQNEEVIQEGFGKSAKSYLTYFYDLTEFEKIEIESLDVSHRALENMLKTYRIRNRKNYR